MRRLKRHQTDLLILVGFGLLPLLFFWPVVIGDRTLLPADNLFANEPWRSAASQFGVTQPHNLLLSDLVLENYPWKKFLLESIQQRELPLWNPYQFAGEPFLATGQHSGLYPLSLVYYLIPLPRAYGLFTGLHFCLAGLFAYVFLRVLGLRRLSATFGALLYQFSLSMVVSVVFQMLIAATVWLPLILTALELIARQQPALGGRPATLPWISLGAVALGMQILAGHGENTAFTLLVAGLYALWRLGQVGLSAGRQTSLRRGLLVGFRRGTAMALMVGLGVALGAIQIIPLVEVVQANFREGSASLSEVLKWGYPVRHILAFLIPNFYGNPAHHEYFDLFTGQWTAAPLNNHTIDWGIKNYVEGGAYVGLLPLLLMGLLATVWVADKLRRRAAAVPGTQAPFFAGLAFFSLACAFGTPVYALVYYLPFLRQSHSPFRWVWVFSLCAAVLSGYGIEYLSRSRCFSPPPAPARTCLRRLGAWLLRVFCLWPSAPSIITFFAGLAVWGGGGVLAGLSAARMFYAPLAGLMDRSVADLALASQSFDSGRMFFSYEARWVFISALLLVSSGIVLRVSRCPIYFRRRPVWEYLALIVLTLDLWVAGWDFNPAAAAEPLTYLPPSVQFLKQDTTLWRFTTYDTQGAKPFNMNVGWYFNLYDIRGYDSIFPKQYRRYMELIQPQGEVAYNRIAPLNTPDALNSPLLDLLNVKYVISLEPLDNPKYTLVYNAEVKIYRNETAMPRAYLMPVWATLGVDDFATAVQQFDPRQYVMIAGDVLGLAAQPTPVTEIDYTPNEVVLTTTTVIEDSWLVLNDSYFPGWKAFFRPAGAAATQEQETRIYLVNGNFRGVQLPAGTWTVRFKYTPLSIKLGGLISFIALITLGFGLGVWLWRYFYQESALNSSARRLAKNSLALMGLSFLGRGIDLIFAMFYLRVLSADAVGKYTFAIVIYGWVEIVTNYGLNAFLMRAAAQDKDHSNRYLVNTTILRLLLGVGVVPVLALLLGARQLLPNPLAGDTLWAIALLVIGQFPATLSTGLTALFYVYEKAEYPAALGIVATILKVALGTVGLLLGLGFVGLAGVSIVVNLITLVILSALVWRLFFRPRWAELDWQLQRGALRESFPLMLNHLLATLFFKVDVPLLQYGRGDKEVGWYNTAYKFLDAYNVIPSAFTTALFPLMSRQAQDQPDALRRNYALAVKLLVTIALPLAVFTSFTATGLINVLGGAQYLPHGAIALTVMVWSIPFGWINSLTNYLLIAVGQQRGLTRAFALALGFNIVANLLLIPRYGYVAAAGVTIASEIVEGACFYWYLRKSLGPLPWRTWLRPLWLAAAGMAALTYMLWPTQPWLALTCGTLLYTLSVLALNAFLPEELATLVQILPDGVRRRFQKPGGPPA